MAIRHGADARFVSTSRIVADLAGGHADGTWAVGCDNSLGHLVLILDDFGTQELTARQADDLYELISERAGRSLVLTSNRAPVDWYPLFPNAVVAKSVLDRLINTSHQVCMNGPGYRPTSNPECRHRQEERHRVEHHQDLPRAELRERRPGNNLSIHNKGVGTTAISWALNVDEKTEHRYARAATAEELLTEVTKRGSDLDEHTTYPATRRREGHTNGPAGPRGPRARLPRQRMR